MAEAYLFVHFREKPTPDGEQVYFGLSRDGFHWEAVNGGRPVLWAFHGDKGVRDHTIVRRQDGSGFVILSTDLSLAYGMKNQYHGSWDEIGRHGSHCLSVWESPDLVSWTEQRLVDMGDDGFGCCWAPDAIWDAEDGSWVLHWSSSHRKNDYGNKAIFYSRTKDFRAFTAPRELYRSPENDVIDSAIYREGGVWYMFVKFSRGISHVRLLRADAVEGPWTPIAAFDAEMEKLQRGQYEAPTAVRLDDGRWCLFLDYYGVRGAGQGYVPFVADSLSGGKFIRSDASFSFPYGFKHGTILPISLVEYERIRGADWHEDGSPV